MTDLCEGGEVGSPSQGDCVQLADVNQGRGAANIDPRRRKSEEEKIAIIIKDTKYFAEPDVLNGEGCLSLQRRSKCSELYGQRGQSAE